MAGAFAIHIISRQPVKFVMDEADHLVEGMIIALVPRTQGAHIGSSVGSVGPGSFTQLGSIIAQGV